MTEKKGILAGGGGGILIFYSYLEQPFWDISSAVAVLRIGAALCADGRWCQLMAQTALKPHLLLSSHLALTETPKA